MIPSENIRYPIIAIIVTCHSPMKNSAMENRDYSFIQITRDDKLIDFIIFTAYCSRIPKVIRDYDII